MLLFTLDYVCQLFVIKTQSNFILMLNFRKIKF